MSCVEDFRWFDKLKCEKTYFQKLAFILFFIFFGEKRQKASLEKSAELRGLVSGVQLTKSEYNELLFFFCLLTGW